MEFPSIRLCIYIEFNIFGLIGLPGGLGWQLSDRRGSRTIFFNISNTLTMTQRPDQSTNRIVLGATVVLREETTGQHVTYRIVDAEEADVTAGRLSVASPLARALIGKEEGDVVTFEAPAGTRRFEVLEVHYE